MQVFMELFLVLKPLPELLAASTLLFVELGAEHCVLLFSFSEFKGREILSVLLCLHLGQGQTNPLLWVLLQSFPAGSDNCTMTLCLFLGIPCTEHWGILQALGKPAVF